MTGNRDFLPNDHEWQYRVRTCFPPSAPVWTSNDQLPCREIVQSSEIGEEGRTAIIAAIQARVSFYDALTHKGVQLQSRGTRRSILDDDLAAVEAALSGLRLRRNLLAPAAACPPEVLVIIFHYLSRIEPNDYTDPADFAGVVTRKLPPRSGWMKVLRVCSSWRRAARGDGRLWAGSITTSLGLRWTAEMLRLSKGLPLRVDFLNTFASNQERQPFSRLLDDHMQRVSGLQILGDQEQWSRNHVEICRFPVPLLETLTFYTRGCFSTLPENAFTGHAPRLRELYLHNVVPPWYLLGPNVTDLTLITGGCVLGPNLVKDMLAALSIMPNLERLCVKNHEFREDNTEKPVNKGILVQCPHLTDITLHCTTIASTLLVFSRLNAHADARVSLAGLYARTWEDWEPDQDAFDVFAERMANLPIAAEAQTVEWRSYGVPHLPIRKEEDKVDIVYERTLTLSMWRTDQSDYLLDDYDDYEKSPPPDLKLTLGTEASQVLTCNPEDVLPWPQSFPSARNVSLQMTKRFPFQVSSWPDVFSSFLNLSFLRIDRQLAEDFLTTLNGDPEGLPKSIETLALLGVFWGRADSDDPESTDHLLAHIWKDARRSGGGLSSVILGDVPRFDADWHECVKEAGVLMGSVKRPCWLGEDHPDWDDRSNW